jgi:predicted transcriptional regulator
MEEDGAEYFTDTKSNLYSTVTQELDFDELVETFNSIVDNIINDADEEEFNAYWQPRIVQITDKYLGKGMKVTQCSRDQVEALDLIVTDLKELAKFSAQAE